MSRLRKHTSIPVWLFLIGGLAYGAWVLVLVGLVAVAARWVLTGELS